MIHYINEETEADFTEAIKAAQEDSHTPLNYLYKYVPYEAMLSEGSKSSLFFIRLELWNDPYESLVLTGKYEIERNKFRNHPLYGHALATCFTDNYGSEAQWKVYEQNEPKVLLSFNKTRLIEALNKSEDHFYIGKISYRVNQPDIKKEVEKWAKEQRKYFETPVDFSKLEEDDFKKLLPSLLIKRKPFEYEHEYRIFILNKEIVNHKKLIIPGLEKAIGTTVLSPVLPDCISDDEKERLWEEYKKEKILEQFHKDQKKKLTKYGFNIFNESSLYKEKEEPKFNLYK